MDLPKNTRSPLSDQSPELASRTVPKSIRISTPASSSTSVPPRGMSELHARGRSQKPGSDQPRHEDASARLQGSTTADRASRAQPQDLPDETPPSHRPTSLGPVSPSCAVSAAFGTRQVDAIHRTFSPMSSEEFGGDVRKSFSDDLEFQRVRALKKHKRDMARWREMQGSFHGREVERRRNATEEGALGTAAGPAEPRTPDGLEPGVGSRGEMLGDEWIGYGREPDLGPLALAETESYEEELTLPRRSGRS